MDECRVIKVIKTDLLRKGAGTEGSPIRLITQYYTLKGELLASIDPWFCCPHCQKLITGSVSLYPINK